VELPQILDPVRTDPDWYKPGQSMSEFHASRARIRVLIGGRGSGKTTGVAVEVVGHAMHNAGAKIYILRKTQDSNEDTTQETFEQVFGYMGDAYIDTGVSLFKKIQGGKCFRLPSVLAIRYFEAFKQANPKATRAQITQWLDNMGSKLCSFVYFAGVPSAQYRASRFRGYECSMLVFVEADQLEREDLDLGVACLRWKGSDPDICDAKGFIRDTCVILDSNPPSPRHWIAVLEREAIAENDTTRKWWHIPTRENKHNLPPNYVEDLEKQYKNNPAMFQRMLLGQYADAFDGKPVFFAFREPYHAVETLNWPKGAYLVRGWDFGTTQAVVWSAYWAEQYLDDKTKKMRGDEFWWDLYEYFAEQSDVERQCRAVLELTEKVFPFWNDRDICSGVLDFCDVAGTQKKDTGSSIVTVHSHSIYPAYSRMGLQESITIYNRLLERKDRFGRHVYKIDKTTCPMLYTASIGGYRYPEEGEPGFGGNEPLKGISGQNYDHISDAARYSKVGCLKIIKAEAEAAMRRVGPLAEKTPVNRNKRYY
jgi:PBSX family phage terminase large subunit